MRVLHVAHGFPPGAAGGTELYVEALARTQRAQLGDEVHVLAREADPSRPELAVRQAERHGIPVTLVNNTFAEVRSFEESYRNERIRRVAGELAAALRPDVAHVHHLTGLSTDVVLELAGRGVPVVLTLNDFWLLCQRGQLLDLELRRCEGPTPDGCARCLGLAAGGPAVHAAARLAREVERRLPVAGQALRGAATGLAGRAVPPGARAQVEQRLAHVRSILDAADRILAPSRTVRDRFVAFGVDPSRIELQVQGIDVAPLRAAPRRSSDSLRLGFLGSLMVSKAPHLLLEAWRELPPGRAGVHVFGRHADYHGDRSYREVLEPLLRMPGVRHEQDLPHERIGEALAGLDVLVVPSIWLENAPFVIKEAFAAGVPVVAAGHGGMAELVEHGRNGLLFAPGDAADLRAALRRLLDEPALLPALRGGIRAPATIEADARATRAVYEAVRRAGAHARRPRLSAVVLNYRTPAMAAHAVQALAASERTLDEVLVVDNGSADGSEEQLRRELPLATVLQAGANLGFSGGCNVGIRRALAGGAELVLLVNSDATVSPACVGRLEEALRSRPDLGVVAPALLCASDPGRLESLGIDVSLASGRMRHRGHGRLLAQLAPPPLQVVDAVSGCVMLVRRQLLERVGLLAEEYFFSFEDVDLCLRAARAGFATACVPAATALHQGSRTIGRTSGRRLYFATRNHLLLARRLDPGAPALFAAARGASIVALNLAHALLRAEAPLPQGLVSLARGVKDHLLRRYGDGP